MESVPFATLAATLEMDEVSRISRVRSVGRKNMPLPRVITPSVLSCTTSVSVLCENSTPRVPPMGRANVTLAVSGAAFVPVMPALISRLEITTALSGTWVPTATRALMDPFTGWVCCST